MGWRRIGNHEYFYRPVRVGGRVVQEYFGRGEAGVLMARIKELDRLEREERRAGELAELETYENAEQQCAAWFAGVQAVARAVLLAAGYHEHRGQWRKRRGGGGMSANDTAGTEITTAANPGPPAKPTRADLEALIERADGGDRGALRQLREALRSGDHSDLAEWFPGPAVNPAAGVKTMLALRACGKDRLGSRLAAERLMEGVRDELAGPNPTPLERLLAERVALLWFAANTADVLAQAKDLTIRQAEHYLRKSESANRRFLAAAAALARVKKLALPALQVNVGVNQVNVAPPLTTGAGE
jgi:hypothetical protein